MNWKLVGVGGLVMYIVMFIVSFPSGMIVHEKILDSAYRTTEEFWRPELNQDPPDMASLMPRWIGVGLLASFIMAADLNYSRTEGWLLLTGLAALVIWMVRFGMRRGPEDPLAEEFAAEIPSDMPTRTAVKWLVVGLIILPLSSRFLVEGAVTIARAMERRSSICSLAMTIEALISTLKTNRATSSVASTYAGPCQKRFHSPCTCSGSEKMGPKEAFRVFQ